MTLPRLPTDRWVFDEYAPCLPGLAAVRVAWALVLIAFYLPVSRWATEMPPAFLDPPPGLPAAIVALFGGALPPTWVVDALNVLLAGATVLVLVGHRTLLASFVAVGLLLVLRAIGYSFGKINHDLLFVMMPAFLAPAGWGGAMSLDAARRPELYRGDDDRGRGWFVALFAGVVAVMMFYAAWKKLRGGWLDLDRSAVWYHVFRNQIGREREPVASELALEMTPAWFWEAQDWATIALEGAFVIAVFRRRLFALVCATAVFFHVGVWATMSIFFAANLVAYATFADWRRHLGRPWVARLFAAGDRLAGRLRPGVAWAAALVVGLGVTFVGNPGSPLRHPVFGTDWPVLQPLACAVALAAAGACFAGLPGLLRRR